MSRRFRAAWLSLSPWAILGGLIVVAPLALFFAFTSFNRDVDNTRRLLQEKGAALIRSFEAGTRAGLHHGWGDRRLQQLLEETGRLPDIVYLSITDERGAILAHSVPEKIGQTQASGVPYPPLSQESGPVWRLVSLAEGERVFEVFRPFIPTFRGRRLGWPFHGGPWRGPPPGPPLGPPPGPPLGPPPGPPPETVDETHPMRYIFVGLNVMSLEEARSEAVTHAIFMGAVMLLIGFAGLLSFSLAQGYKLSQRSLARAEAFSENVVQALPLGLVAFDEEGRIATFNKRAEGLLRLEARRVRGSRVQDVLPAEVLRPRGQESGPLEEPVEIPQSQDEPRPVGVSRTLVRDQDGLPIGSILILRDLTEERRLRSEVERNRRLASVGSLAAGVAHEIRNPLSSIKGFATYFKERYKDHEGDRRTAEILIGEVERLDRVISQLLEFARPSALQRRPTSIEELITSSLGLIEGDAQSRRVRVRRRIEPHLPEVLIDPDRLKQALLNLFLNAIQAMGREGELTVSAGLTGDGMSLRIGVSDTGKGIDSRDRERIFDPYFTTKAQGTGLGLAIVHNIVEAHGGTMEVDSAPDQGTTMAINLPVTRDKGEESLGQGG